MQPLKFTLSLFTFIFFCIFTVACTFDTAVDPVELDHTVSGYGYYNKATLDSGRTYHINSLPLPIKLEQFYRHSDCSFDSIALHSFTTMIDTTQIDTTLLDTTQVDSISTFNVGYIVYLTNSSDPNCVTQEAVDDTTIILEPIWDINDKQININNIIITEVTVSIADSTKDSVTYRDSIYMDTIISVLDTILLTSGNYDEKNIFFAIDSNFEINSHIPEESNTPTETREYSTPTIERGLLLYYEYQSPVLDSIENVEWISSYCIDDAEVKDCETEITLDVSTIKTPKKSIIYDIHDTTIDDILFQDTISIDTIDATIEKEFTNIRKQIHQYICYDSTANSPIYRVNETTSLSDSIMLSICDTAHAIDITLIDSLDPNDSASITQTISFYEQCIKEEEIVCATYPDCINGNKNLCTILDTIVFDSLIGDSTFILPEYDDKTIITERTKCTNGNTYCLGDTDTTLISPDTTYYYTTYFNSVAYIEEINKCDSINFVKVNRNQYQYNGYVELYRELFEINDPYHCSDGRTKLDFLVWDLSKFNKIIPNELTHEHDGEIVKLRDTILSQQRNPFDHVDPTKH